MQIVTWNGLVRSAIYLVVVFLILPGCCMLYMNVPGSSYRGPLPAATERQTVLRAALERDVTTLATTIGERHIILPERFTATVEFIESSFSNAGYAVKRQTYKIGGLETHNLVAELAGSNASGIVVVGAHYDTVSDTPGADDNASGVAGVLALARLCAGTKPARTIRFVAFANEEPPFFWTQHMGSLVYAKQCRAQSENIVAMFSLEMIGYYTNVPKSQKYPPPFSLFFPDTGNFIAFIGNLHSKALLDKTVRSFRKNAQFPSEGIALPGWFPGAGLSDQWSFWKMNYPALMVTDTSFFRYEQYHTPGDTPDRLDFDCMARVVEGMEAVVKEIAGGE